MLVLTLLHFSSYAQGWLKVNIPHDNLSFISEMKTPTTTAVWGLESLFDPIGGTQTPTNRFIRSTDAGATWLKKGVVTANPNLLLSNIFPIDGDTCYVAMYDGSVGTGGGIFKTINKGVSWGQLGTGLIFDASSFPNWVYFHDPKHGIAMGDARGPGTKFEIYTTANYGKTWNRVPDANIPAIGGYPYGVVGHYFAYGNRVWFYAYEGDATGARTGAEYLYRSDDGGHNWVDFPINNTVAGVLTDFAFIDEMKGIYIGQQNDGFGTPIMLRTQNGGATWTSAKFNGPLMNAFINNVPGTPALVTTSGFLLGTAAGSSYSLDLGKNWTIVDTGASLLHTDLSFYSQKVGWTGQYRQTSATSGGAYKLIGTLIPAAITNFTLSKTEKSALLNWQINSGSGLSYFGIERSTDGTNFTEISRVNIIANAAEIQPYSFEDANIAKGKSYYRLTLVNADGKYNYSIVRNIDFSILPAIKLFPNPVKDILYVEGLNAGANTTLFVMDNGERIMQQQTVSGAAYNLIVAKLHAGNYYLKVMEGNTIIANLKFIKE